MKNRPRKHHFVPSFCLAGFTASGSDEDRLYVFDQGQIRSWRSIPKKAGREHEFYAVDLGPEVDPACFESGVLARIETEFGRVVRTSIKEEELPQGSDFDVLLNFVAVTATRTPRIRRLVGQVTDSVIKSMIQSLVRTDDGWQQFQNHLRDAGVRHTDDEVVQMRTFILSGQYDIDLDQTSHVQKIVELVDAMLPLLGQRHWSLGIAASGTPDFVCSDAAVSLAPTDRFASTDELHLANRNTLLSIPLTRRSVLLGCYEVRPPVFHVNEFGVLSTNALTISEAKHIFSAEEDFAYLGSDKQRKHRADLEQSLRHRGAKYSNLSEAVAHWFQRREYLLGTLIAANREFEGRVGAVAGGRGAKSELVLSAIGSFHGEFTVCQIQEQCPTVGIDLIRRILREQKQAGKLECLGRGLAASWRRK